MATEAGESEDPFLVRTGVIRKDLEKRFAEYQISLQQRKDELSAKLDTAEREYTASRVEYKQKLQAIEQIQTNIKQQTVSFKSMEHNLLAEINKQILQIKDEYPERGIELVIDPTFNQKIQTLGQIDVTILPKYEVALEELEEIRQAETAPLVTVEAEQKSNTKPKDRTKPLKNRDYTKLTHPIVSAVKQGDRPCDLKYPRKVAVDSKTGNIFIADQTSHCVKIYSQEGEYLSTVKCYSTQCQVELVHPYGVCFYRDSLYVTSLMEQKSSFDSQPCVFKFIRDSKSDTKFLYSRFNGIHGPYESLFKRPSAISADQENGDVYVCDEESKVQVLDKNLNYKRMLTNEPSNIADVQVAKEGVYLLCDRKLHILSKKSGCVTKSFEFSCQSSAMYIVANPFFILDGVRGEHNISVVQEANIQDSFFNKYSSRSFNTLSSFSIKPNPADDGCFAIRGITVDESTQKIIVVCYSKDNMLQIY